MGVRGLTAYLERSEGTAQDVNLTEVAAGRPGNEIALVLDLSNIAYTLIQQAAEEAAQLGGRGDVDGPAAAAGGRSLYFLVNISGGEYDLLDAHVERYFGRLRAAGVRAHCFLDPAKGSDDDEERKLATWTERLMEDRLGAMALQKWCSTGRGAVAVGGASGATGGGPGPGASALRVPVPPLAFRQIIRTLQRLQVPVSICTGEADQQLLHEMRRRGAFAIVSDDSDFAVMSARHPPPAEGAQVEDVAAWIRGLPGRSALSSPALRDLLARHADLREAWERSAAFYMCEAPPPPTADARLAFLEGGVAEGILPGHAIAVARFGRHWSSARAECVQCSRSPSSDELVAPLRAAGYALLGRDEVEERVVEAGAWSLTRRVVRAFLPHAARHVPDTWAARAAPPEARRRALAAILHTHIPSAPPDPPAGPLGPAALLLRYLLSLVPASGLDMTVREWRAILLTVAACARASSSSPPLAVDGAQRAALARCAPSFREVLVAYRLQAVFTACAGIGQALWEPDFFPEPRALFSGLLFRRLLRAPAGAPAEAAEAAAQLLALVAAAFPPAGEAHPALRRFLSVDLRNAGPPAADPAEKEAEEEVPLHRDCWEEVEALWDEEGDSDEDVEAMLESAAAGAAERPPTSTSPLSAAAAAGPPLQDGLLPIDAHKKSILEHIARHRVTCIQGETGSGKSSKLPVFLLEEARKAGQEVRMVITQPRRIAAMSLAKRVADLVGCKLGETVGYCVSRDRAVSPRTRVTYVTVGYLLQLLSHKPAEAGRYTHIFLDEVHERGVDQDLLSLLVKLLLKNHPSVKLIVMSATLHAELFSQYFADLSDDDAPPAPIFVGAARYPLEFLYLEDLPSKFSARRSIAPLVKSLLSQAPFKKGAKQQAPSSEVGAGIRKEMFALAVDLLAAILSPGKTVLVFLPGIAEMTTLQMDVQERIAGACDGSLVEVLLLHSTMPREEQAAAFAPLNAARSRLILATNIAESSITLPAVHYVVDFGLHRQIVLDKARGVQGLSLSWCSRASCKQRAGRAGRLFPGTVIRLMSKDFHDRALPDFEKAEMLRISLEHAILRVKILFAHFGTVRELLARAVESPTKEEIDHALRELYFAGATTGEEEDAGVTLFGQLASVMPVGLTASKLIMYGLLFHVECDAVCMAAAMAVQDPFASPTQKYTTDVKKYCEDLARSFRSRTSFDEGNYSELIAFRNVWIDWTRAGRRRDWTYNNCVSFERMRAFDATVADVATHFVGFLSRNGADVDGLPGLVAMSQRWKEDDSAESWTSDAFSSNAPLLKAVIALSSRPGFFLRPAPAQAERTGIKKIRAAMLTAGLEPSRTLQVTLGISGGSAAAAAREFTPADFSALLRDLLDVKPEKVVKDENSKSVFYVQFRADKPKGPSHGSDEAVIHDLPKDAKLVRYLTGVLSFQQKFSCPLRPEARRGPISPEEPMVVFESIVQLGGFMWRAMKPTCTAKADRRTPLSNASEFDAVEALWAVASDAQLQGNNLFVSGTTVLPRGHFGALLLLATGITEHGEGEEVGRPVRLYVDRQLTHIHSAALPGSPTTFSFAPHFPSLRETVEKLNRLRACLSASYAPGIWPRSSEVRQALADLLACVPSEPATSAKPSSKKDEQYRWVSLPTAEDGAAERPYAFLPPYVGPIAEGDMALHAAGEDLAVLRARAASWSLRPAKAERRHADLEARSPLVDANLREEDRHLAACIDRMFSQLEALCKSGNGQELELEGSPEVTVFSPQTQEDFDLDLDAEYDETGVDSAYTYASACVWLASSAVDSSSERRVLSCQEAPSMLDAIAAAVSSVVQQLRLQGHLPSQKAENSCGTNFSKPVKGARSRLPHTRVHSTPTLAPCRSASGDRSMSSAFQPRSFKRLSKRRFEKRNCTRAQFQFVS
eukprot:tig00000204_g17723.t1